MSFIPVRPDVRPTWFQRTVRVLSVLALFSVAALGPGCESGEEVRAEERPIDQTFGYVETQPAQPQSIVAPIDEQSRWMDEANTGVLPTAQAVPGIRAGGEAVRITATDFAYEPNEIRAAPQMPMTITLINRGDSRHSIAFELPAGEPRLEQPIKSGDESQIRFTTPSEPGEYRFYCPVSDHRRRGMTGLLIIEQAPSPTSGDSQ